MSWKPIDTAPRDATRFIARGMEKDAKSGRPRYKRKITWYGKASHIPLYGWCFGKVENVDLWRPTEWKPL